MAVTADNVNRHVLAGLRGESEEGLEPLDEGAEGSTQQRSLARDDAAGSQTLIDDAAKANASANANANTHATDNSRGGDAGAGATNTGAASDAGTKSTSNQQGAADTQAATQAANTQAASLGSETLNGIFSGASNTFETATVTNQTGAIALSDDSPITVDGVTMKFGEYKAFGKPRVEFDRERTEMLQKERELERNTKIVETVLPHVEAVQNDPYMRTYADTLVSLRSRGVPEQEAVQRAHGAAAAAAGYTPATTAAPAAQQVDPRLVPPKDEQGNELPVDDARYLAWKTGPFVTASIEQGLKQGFGEIEQKRQREQKVEQDRIEADRRKQQQEQDFHDGVFRRNKETLAKLPEILTAKGVDRSKVPQHVFMDAAGQMIDRARAYGKDLRDDNWLRNNLLSEGDLVALVDASGIAERLRLNPMGMSQTGAAAATATNGATNGQAATSNATQTVNANGAATNGNVLDPNAGRLRMAKQSGNRPLNAGGPSDAVPNQATQRDDTQDPSWGWKSAYEGLHE